MVRAGVMQLRRERAGRASPRPVVLSSVRSSDRGLQDGEPMYFFVQEEMLMQLFEEFEKIQGILNVPDEQPKDL